MSQIVEIKLQTNEINIKLNEQSTYEEIIKVLTTKIQELKNLYKEDKTPIYITGKVLKNIEIQEIKKLIQSQINVEVKFESPEVLGLHGIRKTYNEDVGTSNTLYHRGSLRSGQKIENEGSIVIIGDVNSGAEIIAGENIAILGRLMGLAHAGAKGNKKAIIAAQNIDVKQIRISNIVKQIERTQEDNIKNTYTYAYVNEEGNKIELE